MVASIAILALSTTVAATDPATQPLDDCPEGASLRGASPPRGRTQWCEGPDLFGRMRRNGPFRAWHDNGRIRASGSFVDGEPNGQWREWDANGRLLVDRRYRFGTVVENRRGPEPSAGVQRPRTAPPSAAPPRPRRGRPPSRSSFDEQTSRLETEVPASPVGGYGEADFVVYGTDGAATFSNEIEVGLVLGPVDLGVQWGWVFADASGTSSAEALNPTFSVHGRIPVGPAAELRLGAGASIPVRDLTPDTLTGVAVVGLAAVPRGYWNAWMYLPRDPYIVLPISLRVDSTLIFDAESTFYFAIPPQGASSQLNLQLSASAAYPVADILETGLEIRSVLASLTAVPEATFGIEPFAKIWFEPGFFRAGFTVYPAYSRVLGGPAADGVVWGLDLGLGFEL